jgi:hypothetical protein
MGRPNGTNVMAIQLKKKMNNAISVTTEEHLHMERATDVGQLEPAINLVKNAKTVNTCLWH